MHALTRTARMTGLFYLGNAITGVLGFLLIRPQLFAADDPSATLANLVAHESLARAGVALELLMVVTQTLTAVWFYRLFRTVDAFAAERDRRLRPGQRGRGPRERGTAGHGGRGSRRPGRRRGGQPSRSCTWSATTCGAWERLFFGLWLIPMGWCVLRSGWMPRALGWILVGGGVGYVLSAFIGYLAPDAQVVAEALAYPAHVGEFWMVGYLLVRGVRRQALDEAPPTVHTPTPTVT